MKPLKPKGDALALAVRIIKHHEGFRGKAYRCPAGVWTIGYGSTRLRGRSVKPSDTISKSDAERLLRQEVSKYLAAVKKANSGLKPHEEAAFTSFAFNVGVPQFRRSTVYRHLSQGRETVAIEAIRVWCRGGGRVLSGLQARRLSEIALFRKGTFI